MKKTIVLCFLMAAVFSAPAQYMQKFLYSPGVKDMGVCAHLTNTYDHGSYSVTDDYITIDIYYTDKNLDGQTVATEVKMGRGFGSLYFTSLEATYDNDYVSPFDAFGAASWLIAQLARKLDPQKYNEIKQAMIDLLDTNPDYWNGADWALFAMNLDYASYLLN